jgi:hypothetical protein
VIDLFIFRALVFIFKNEITRRAILPVSIKLSVAMGVAAAVELFSDNLIETDNKTVVMNTFSKREMLNPKRDRFFETGVIACFDQVVCGDSCGCCSRTVFQTT